ncbi:arylamine N-acetyltransferase family protein [Janthinobacterium sp. B9-8]|uniref:arylamine N-acetyltransferase family protein n=1 Tax=Janthinobacterium sp. B9-8 TaxID=1236179 RepID=UPI00069BB546|nr:arylamine N-acetyltransferase [Janthinobacterium sp. B9-8]AMC33545.1 hypothetical protein VN23_02495 [Janthinobacterium sp. B9-8]
MTWLNYYLKRLSLTSWPTLDQAGLAFLQRRHIESIAFGNVDLLLGNTPKLNHDALVEKLLIQGRPGYCYEINTLFASLLNHLGLKTTLHMARVLLNKELVHERPRSHLIMTIEQEGQTWLLDAGFGGGGICEPISLQAGVVFDQSIDRYRLLPEQTLAGWYLQREINGEWNNLYWFDLTTAYPVDCHVGNHYAATESESIFLRDLMVTRIDGIQRLVLHNRQLSIRSKTDSSFKVISTAVELQNILDHYFGFGVQPDQAELLFKMGDCKD